MFIDTKPHRITAPEEPHVAGADPQPKTDVFQLRFTLL